MTTTNEKIFRILDNKFPNEFGFNKTYDEIYIFNLDGFSFCPIDSIADAFWVEEKLKLFAVKGLCLTSYCPGHWEIQGYAFDKHSKPISGLWMASSIPEVICKVVIDLYGDDK